MKRVLIAAVVALLAGAPARAAFDDLGVGARAPGMGNAFVPVADDVYGIYYNPAGLGLLETPQIGTSYTSLYPGLTDGSALATSFMAYAQPLSRGKDGTLGVAWNAFTLNSSLYREDSFYLSYGRRLADWGDGGQLYAGLSGKYLRTSLGSFSEATNGVPTNGVVGNGSTDPALRKRTRGAFDSDLGLLYRLGKNYAAGVSVIHANQPNVAFSGDDRLPMGVKLGLDYRSLISNVVLEYDTERGPTQVRDNVLTVGLERWLPTVFYGDFGLRGGLSLGSRDMREASAGASYRTHRLEFDYSLGLPLGGVATAFQSQRVALTLRFGGLSQPEESLALVLEAMKQFKAGQPVDLKVNEGQLSGGERLTIDEFLAQSRGSMNRAQYGAALDFFGKALSVAPANQELLSRYGRLNVVAQEFKALPNYKSDPAQATLHLAILAYLGGDDLEAVRQATEALSVKPDWKEAGVFLGMLEVVTGVKRATFPPQRVDRDAAVKLARANAAIEDGDYALAIELADDVLKTQPGNVAAWEDLGTSYFALRKFDRALAAWRKAFDLEKSPAMRKAIANYLKAINRAKDRSHAVEAPVESEARPAMTPERERALFNQALDLYTKRQFDDAKSLLEQILDADPQNIEAQKALRRVKSEMP